MAEEIRIAEAIDGKAYRDFLEIPYIVQGSNPVWVPPLRVQYKELHDTAKNPFYEHAKAQRFVAYEDGKPVGSIVAINDDAHNRTHNEMTCHFGFFESIESEEVASALFAAVETAAREWNLDMIRGPFNPSINESLGILIDPYDIPPMILMPYNPPYYPRLIEAQGYTKAMDIYSYTARQEEMTEKLRRGAEAIRKRSKLVFRTFSKKHFWRDALKIWEVYKKAWEDNWCAVPMTEREFRHLVNGLKQVADFDQIFIAETVEGKVVGFSLALPDINQALIKLRNGRLLPFGFLRLLWYTRPRAINRVRVPIMGVLKEWRGRGIDAVFYYDHFAEGIKKGVEWGDMGWILEINTMMNSAAEMMGAHRYKTYRLYEKRI